ncbi:hypothetical protein SAMN05444359_101228 [Neolewinella agarilytica]|uniref:Uncharacterized protein n=1 Tax=Neolewinella agarilytica TaxID=478744 RepID=A0A1H8Z9D7_9BACT|nr:hypothetical protein SAMN05444359_101228 [Neolewinella agarilytica]
MDEAPEVSIYSITSLIRRVLILLVMDEAPEAITFGNLLAILKQVLILLVMDEAPEAAPTTFTDTEGNGLNPSCDG